MSIGLKKHAKMMAVGVALSLVCLVIVRTAVAEVQHAESASIEADQDNGVNIDSAITESLLAPEPSERLEAYIGDSLRPISRRNLGSRANPPQVATEAEQIVETNRNRLGDGSGLVTPGEGFLLPPVTEPDTNPPGSMPENTPEAGEPAASVSVEPTAESAAVSETSKPVESPGEGLLLPPVTEPDTNLPGSVPENTPEAGEPAASVSVEPTAESAAVSETSKPVESAVGAPSGMPKASWLNERRLVGLGIVVLTLAFTILILWKMPIDRHVKRGVGNVRISEPPNPSESLYKRGESRTAGRTFSDPRDHRWVRRRASGKRAS